MQYSGSTGNARKEDRVPLGAVVALSFDDGSDILEADGIDVSPRGLSLRANFVPEIGTRLACRFHCPPHDEPVRALGEVVWGHWQSRDDGVFGMRFLELDTKSATTIRRLLEPGMPVAETPREKPRVASMRIEGLEVPIETEVKRADQNCIVLEQDLTFLRLGRNVQVDMGGRGTARGRIASVELRHGPMDVPTLVFGVLLDGAAETAREAEHAPEPAAVRGKRVSAAPVLDPPFGEGHTPARDLRADNLSGARADDSLDVLPISAYVTESARTAANPPAPQVDPEAYEAEAHAHSFAGARPLAHTEDDSDDDGLDSEVDDLLTAEARLAARGPGLDEALVALRGVWSSAQGKWLALRARFARRDTDTDAAEPELAPRSPLLRLVHATGRVSASVQNLLKRTGSAPKRRTTSPARARVVRAQSPKAQTKAVVPPARSARNQRLAAAALVIIGVGVGVYALAPRSGADRITAGRFASAVQEPAPLAAAPIVVPTVEPIAPVPVPVAAEPVPVEDTTSLPAPFGEAKIENGRTFVLRMSGSVRSVEGEARDDGFTVRIPGRLALDRASPIATANRAIARAMVLNRGEYAELTVDFLPGMHPKYQVQGKGSTIEVTLERQ